MLVVSAVASSRRDDVRAFWPVSAALALVAGAKTKSLLGVDKLVTA